MDPASRHFLLPPVHISSKTTSSSTRHHRSDHRSPSPSPIRTTRSTRAIPHCDDPDCFIWTSAPQAERWRVFDTFDPRDVEENYGCLPTYDARRLKRATEIRTRAKARLMPPFDLSQRRNTTVARRTRNQSTLECPSTPRRVDIDRAYRTPSPPPMRSDVSYFSPYASVSPRTPVRGVRALSSTPMTHTHTPASTVASSPVPTPLRPSRFQSPSP